MRSVRSPTWKPRSGAIDSWVDSYNQQRPHQSLGMATPASLFRARPTAGRGALGAGADPEPVSASAAATSSVVTALAQGGDAAVEFEVVVPPSGNVAVAGQHVWVGRQFAGRTATIGPAWSVSTSSSTA